MLLPPLPPTPTPLSPQSSNRPRRHTISEPYPSTVAPQREKEALADLTKCHHGKYAASQSPSPSQSALSGLRNFHTLHATAPPSHQLPHLKVHAQNPTPFGPLMTKSERESEQDVTARHGPNAVLGPISTTEDAPKEKKRCYYDRLEAIHTKYFQNYYEKKRETQKKMYVFSAYSMVWELKRKTTTISIAHKN